jgi:hypothetical protein
MGFGARWVPYRNWNSIPQHSRHKRVVEIDFMPWSKLPVSTLDDGTGGERTRDVGAVLQITQMLCDQRNELASSVVRNTFHSRKLVGNEELQINVELEHASAQYLRKLASPFRDYALVDQTREGQWVSEAARDIELRERLQLPATWPDRRRTEDLLESLLARPLRGTYQYPTQGLEGRRQLRLRGEGVVNAAV